VISHEPSGQEIAHRHAQGLAVHRRHGDDDLRGGEFGQLLAAAAAGRHRLGAIGDDRHLGDPAVARGDHRGDGAGLGAGAFG
jgi:hypothetical protein